RRGRDAASRYVHDAHRPPPRPSEIESVATSRPPVSPVASPELSDSLGPAVTPERLLGAPLLHEEGDGEWRAWFAAHGVQAAAWSPRAARSSWPPKPTCPRSPVSSGRSCRCPRPS